MALTAPARQSSPSGGEGVQHPKQPILKVAVCGSFRRDPATLRLECQELDSEGCLRLSPLDLEFVAIDRGFVLAKHERGQQPHRIEAEHLLAMERADFVWLHSPDGYVGRSAAMELGFAHAVGIPVYAQSPPDEPAFRALVEVVSRPAAAAGRVRANRPAAPSRGLQALQFYYQRAAGARGWARETAEETLERLRGEVEELAEALLQADQSDGHREFSQDVALELADVQLYVVHLANLLGLDLGDAVIAKERINEKRFGQRGPVNAL
jgi:NTP pyrophosphatase (non-canonical NTP hydrolase)